MYSACTYYNGKSFFLQKRDWVFIVDSCTQKNVFLGKLTSSRGCCLLLNCLKMIHNPMCMTHNVSVLFRLAVASNIINRSTASVSRSVWGVVLY